MCDCAAWASLGNVLVVPLRFIDLGSKNLKDEKLKHVLLVLLNAQFVQG